MNKKFLSSAISLLLAGGIATAATAEVTVYGQIDESLNYTDSDGGTDDINMVSNTSAFGLKGSEDLGGMKAIFKVEFGVAVDEGGAPTGRDQYVGLAFDTAGTVKIGTTSTAYKSPGSKIDPMYRTSIQSRNIGLQSRLHSGKGEEGHGRGTNMIRYDSPNMGGAKITATYQFDSVKAGEDDDPFSVGVTYKTGPVYAFASYITTGQDDDNSAAQVGGRVAIGDTFAVRGIYELDMGLVTGHTNGRVGTSAEDGADIWSIGADATFGANMVSVDFGQQAESDGADGTAATADDVEETDVFRVAFQHMMSNRTKVYAGFARADADNSGESDTGVVGIRHKF